MTSTAPDVDYFFSKDEIRVAKTVIWKRKLNEVTADGISKSTRKFISDYQEIIPDIEQKIKERFQGKIPDDVDMVLKVMIQEFAELNQYSNQASDRDRDSVLCGYVAASMSLIMAQIRSFKRLIPA